MREERRQRLHFVEQREADRADGRDDFAHQAVGDDGFAVEIDRVVRIREAEACRVALVDPDDAGVHIDDESALAQILEGLEERLHRAPHDVTVVGRHVDPVVAHCICLHFLFIETV